MPDTSSKKTLYEILGVKPEATPAEIQAAYDALSASAAQGDDARRLALKEAHRVLSSGRRRAAYDDSLRERAQPPAAQVDDDDEVPAGRNLRLILGGVFALLILAGWWVMRKPDAPAKPAAQRTVQSARAEPATAAPAPVEAPAAPAPETVLYGNAWRCTGPLTGRGLELSFAPDGTYAGHADGAPVRGYYTLSAHTLVFKDDEQTNSFAVEQLAAQRLVINRGEGKRLTCSR